MRTRRWLVAMTSLALLSSLVPAPMAAAEPAVQVILDGRRLSLDPAPVIQNSRTLVPLRGLFEAMGASPQWNGENRTVEVSRGSRYVKLQIDRSLACLSPDCTSAATLDVPATLISNRTFVPVRFISQALGVRVSWDDLNRAVVIETDKPPIPQESTIRIQGVTSGQVITGPITATVMGAGSGGQEMIYLVDPATRKARLISARPDELGSHHYTPDPTQAGTRLILPAWKDPAGAVHYGQPITVSVQPNTKPQLTGLQPDSVITGPVTLGNSVDFVATSVRYQLIDPATGSITDLAAAGPGDSFTWYPPVSANGPKQLRLMAYDRAEGEHPSAPLPVTVNSDYRTIFTAIKENESIAGQGKSLSVSTNYEIQSVRYLLDGNLLSAEKSYWWGLGPDLNGPHTMTAEVTDTAGIVRSVGPIPFTIDAKPTLWLTGVGPRQVVTGEVSLYAHANIPVDRLKFFLREGATDTLLGETAPGEKLPWKPKSSGQKTIYAQAFVAGQWVLSTEPVTFQAYTGTVYGPRPVVEKSQFKGLVSALAVKSNREIGMSAALQVAQAILETGWGQSVPVDKYTGQFSYNLFGIKGKGTAGSIISTTWEVYNGQRYVVDDYFRAYNSVDENWRDHKEFLLVRPWYAPFRAVMADPVLGAWALKRSGYATDPQYPIKLINIMKQNGLFELDEVEF